MSAERDTGVGAGSDAHWAVGAGRSPLFAGVPADVTAEAVLALELRHLAPDEHVMDEGAGESVGAELDLYLVLDGKLAVTRTVPGGAPVALATLGPGDLFGELAYADAGPRSATVRALGPAVVGRLERAAVDRLIGAAPVVARTLAAEAARRVRAANDARVEALLDEARMSVLGRTAATLVHDLRNPLGVITSTADMLAEGIDDPQRGAARIKRAAAFLLGMVDDLLAFSRGGASYARELVRVDDVVADVEAFALAPAEAAGRVTVRRDAGDPALHGSAVLGDRRAIVRALGNLVKNAAEATPAGGVVTFTASVTPPAVDATNGLAAGAASFVVADTGPGIPEAVRGTLFRPFATHGKAGGTGLGLAMAKAVVDAHDGTIGVDTSPAGTRFTVTVPLASVPGPAPV